MEKDKRKRSQEEQNYIHGNAAPKIDYEYSLQERYFETPAPSIVPKSEPDKRERNRQSIYYKLNLIGAIFVVFAGCFLLMMGYSAITNQQKQIKDLSAALQEIQNQNSIIKTEIAENVDLEYIKKKAVDELGMVEPASYQMVYIEVPKTSYTVRHNEQSEKQPRAFSIPSFLSFLSKGREVQ